MRKLITLLMITALLAGCSESGIKDKRPVLMVSIDPYRYFIDQISGGRFRAVSLVPRTSNPESYEPTAQQMLDLMNSRAYLSSGYLDFEKTRLKQITDENPHFLLFNLANGIKTLRDSDGNGVDPHVWLSAQNAEIIAKNICSALCRIDSANSEEYKERTEKFTQHIDSIDRQIQSLTGNLVHRTFVIYHPALTYFAKDYGLRRRKGSLAGPHKNGNIAKPCRKGGDSVHTGTIPLDYHKTDCPRIRHGNRGNQPACLPVG